MQFVIREIRGRNPGVDGGHPIRNLCGSPRSHSSPRFSPMTRRVMLYLAVLGCLLPPGCGPKTTYKYKIAVIPKGLTHEFWQSIHRGAERAAADLTASGTSVEVLWNGPARESDTREQI